MAASAQSGLGGGTEVELDFDPVGAVAIVLVAGKRTRCPLAVHEAEEINKDILGCFQIIGVVGEVVELPGSTMP